MESTEFLEAQAETLRQQSQSLEAALSEAEGRVRKLQLDVETAYQNRENWSNVRIKVETVSIGLGADPMAFLLNYHFALR